jgi:hypothetical protein
MAHALRRAPVHNPFTDEEYRTFAATEADPDRLLHSREPGSEVSMALESTLISSQETPPDLSTARDNMGYALLSVANVVFFLQILPPDAPPGAEEVCAPPMLTTPRLARRIWPDTRRQYFPLSEFPPGHLKALLDFPVQFIDAMGLPTVGLTQADAQQVLREFRDGADPGELRQRWNQPD